MPELLKVGDAAEALRLSASAVYRRVQDGELHALRLGTGPKAPVRITTNELKRYMRVCGSKETPSAIY